MTSPAHSLGLDLGGTKTEAVVLNAAGNVLFQRRIATPVHHYEAILQALTDLVDAARNQCGPVGAVGLCAPGALSAATGRVKNSNTVCLNGQLLREDLAERVGVPVVIENDANCFAVSEATDGAAAGLDSVFGVILGTGAGGGMVIHGRLHVGVNHIAGEWGHNRLPPPVGEAAGGRPCYCGRRDCVETYVSGPGLSRTYLEAGGKAQTARQIAGLLEQGDALARLALARYVQHLASALSVVVNVFDPVAIVLGGGMSQVAELYPALRTALPPYVFSDVMHTRILPPKFGDASGVRGAAWLARA